MTKKKSDNDKDDAAEPKEQEAGAPEAATPPDAAQAPGQDPAAQGAMVPEGFTIEEADAATTRADYFAGSFAITEALLAFGRVSRDGGRKISIDTKIILSVRDVKRVQMTLTQLVNQYEEKYGQIRV